ncbi:MAG: DMT family transporter [Sphaerochaetaceae bacterium]
MGVVYLSAFFYSLITGLSFIFGKVALNVSSVIDFLAYRFSASAFGLFLLIIFRLVKVDFNFKKVVKILPLALFYPLLFFAFQSYGLKHATAIETGLITAAVPIFTLIGASLFLKEKTTLFQKLSIIASVGGVMLITIMKNTPFEITNFKGTFLILLSALSFAGYAILARVLSKEFSSIELSAVMILISFIFFNAVALINNAINQTLPAFIKMPFNRQFLISILYLGVLSTLVTSYFSNYILSKIEAAKMSVFGNFGTIITIIASTVYLKESLFYYHVIGTILIIGGVLGTNFLDKRS